MEIINYFALTAILISIATLFLNLKQARASLISSDRKMVSDCSGNVLEQLSKIISLEAKNDLGKLTEDEIIEFKLHKHLKDAYTERLLTTFEVSCGNYLDFKVNRKRFKIIYINEIRELFSDDQIKKILLLDNASYTAIKKVYKKWFIYES